MMAAFFLWVLTAQAGEFDRVLKETNSAMTAEAPRALCPGFKLALSCGNGVCDPGETRENCPTDCDPSPVRSYNSLTVCHDVTRFLEPGTIEEVQDAVRAAAEAGTRVRVVGHMHSINAQLCTAGTVLGTANLNRVIGLETFHGHETVLAEAGTEVGDLEDWLDARGKSLGFAVSGYRGVTIAGAIGTGVHGSSLTGSPVISAAVDSLWVVGPDGTLREYWAGNTDDSTWKALRAHLGMLGAVVRVRLRVEPQFNLRDRITHLKDSALFQPGGAVRLVEGCDFATLWWFPGVKKIVRLCGTKTSAKAQPGAAYNFLDPSIPQLAVQPIKAAFQLSACQAWIGCLFEHLQYAFMNVSPPLEKLNRHGTLAPSSDVTGPSHKMMSSLLSASERKFILEDWEIAVPYSRMHEALAMVRDSFHDHGLCSSVSGIALRFARAEDATLIAHSTALGEFHAGEPVLFLEIPAYQPQGFSAEELAAHELPYHEMVEGLLRKFGGRAHWGKNADWVFDLENELGTYGQHMAEFRGVVHALDPGQLFMNPWGKRVGIAEPDPLERALASESSTACALAPR
jgi:FAD/FMN-containing dehydrogenase